jgi:serine/threonine protein kinase
MAAGATQLTFGPYTLLRAKSAGTDLYLARRAGDRRAGLYLVKKRRRLHDEVGRVHRLRHRNIVDVVDTGTVGDELYAAMEVVHGRDLHAIWNRCAERRINLPVGVTVLATSSLLEAIAHAHANACLHGRIGPTKVMLASSGQVTLTEFLLTRTALGGMRSPAPVASRFPGYLAPEVLAGFPGNESADVFAAGVLAWELLAQTPLFPEVQPQKGLDLLERTRSIAAGTFKVAPPSKLNPRVPAALDAAIMQALAADPDERFRTASEFREALRAGFSDPADSRNVAEFVRVLFGPELEAEREEYARLDVLDRHHRPGDSAAIRQCPRTMHPSPSPRL